MNENIMSSVQDMFGVPIITEAYGILKGER
jgi:hypothetical protein